MSAPASARIQKVLAANRGEIAVRVMRTCAEGQAIEGGARIAAVE